MINKGIVTQSQFNFEPYFSIVPDNNTFEYSNFLEWFIGFIDNNASFFNKYNQNSSTFEIAVEEETLYLAYIQNTLGFGRIYHHNYKGNSFFGYRVEDQYGLDKIIRILNGNLQTPRAYDGLTKIFKNYKNFSRLTEQIELLPMKNKKALNNFWLTGFIDANGTFSIKLQKTKTVVNLTFNFELKVEDADLTLEQISNLLLPNIQKKTKTFKKLALKEDFDILITYLTNFPLRTKKKEVFDLWLEIYNQNKQGILFEDKENLINLKEKINKINLLSNKEKIKWVNTHKFWQRAQYLKSKY